jgi:hypothetical protein
MKPEKMTTEALVGIRQRMESGETMTAGEQRAVLAFIAALEAERDEALEEIDRWKEGCGLIGREGDPARVTPAHLAADLQKRDREEHALRERVKALEEDVADRRALAHKWKTSATGLHATLAAIRQRAGDAAQFMRVYQTGGMVAVARYIVGEDGAGAETPAPYCDEHGASNGECATSHPEPTTAEAFATARKGIGGDALPSACHGARGAIALLERRMGELEALADSVNAGWVEPVPAITATPPDFTLEEVETVVRGALTDSGEWAPVVGIVMSAIRERLHALRR